MIGDNDSKQHDNTTLSGRLEYWRVERPSEWMMDEFIRDARKLEAQLSEAQARLQKKSDLLERTQAHAVRVSHKYAEAVDVLRAVMDSTPICHAQAGLAKGIGTKHQDGIAIRAAESFLANTDTAPAATAAPPVAADGCSHGIRYPHPCSECEDSVPGSTRVCDSCNGHGCSKCEGGFVNTAPATPVAPASQAVDVCRAALEDACVVSWISADLSTIDGAKRAIAALCAFDVQLATDPATNGGKVLIQQPVADDVVRDAERFRWLMDDHIDSATIDQCRSIIQQLPCRSLSGARIDIDAAMLAAQQQKKEV